MAIRSEYAGCLKKKNNNSYVLTFLSLSVNKDSTFAKLYIIDSSGVIKNQNQVASADYTEFNSAQLVENGDIIFAGYSDFIKMGGNNDIHLIRTDSTLSFPQNIFGIAPINNTIPAQFTLHQNYPNPFNPITKIKFDVPVKDNIKLVVYDITGKQITVLVDKELTAGSYETEFDGSNFASGIYFVTMLAGTMKLTRKIALIK